MTEQGDDRDVGDGGSESHDSDAGERSSAVEERSTRTGEEPVTTPDDSLVAPDGDPVVTSEGDPVVTPDEQARDHLQENRVDERIRSLAQAAIEDREAFESPSDPPDEQRAMAFLREGFGPAVCVYIERHTGESRRQFGRAELALLQRAMNDWLELYARCYGVELEAAFTVREAAKLLIETRNVKDTAQLLTRVPQR